MRSLRLWFPVAVFLLPLFFLIASCSGTGPEITPAPTIIVTPIPEVPPTPVPTPSGPVHNVTQDTYYVTIQAAIDAAQNGDRIEISPGVYYENINFKGKNIVLRSESPLVVAQTIIDGGGEGSVVTFEGGETSEAFLLGLTIRNGAGTEVIRETFPVSGAVYLGGGIYVKGSSPTIMYNVIEDNEATRGGGIYVTGASSPEIVGNRIEDNQSEVRGGGICVDGNSSPLIHQNAIYDNHATGGSPGLTSLSLGGGISVGPQATVKDKSGNPWPRNNCPPAGADVSGTWLYQDNTFFGNTHGGDPDNGCHVYFE